ncbi:KilA-N domain-containing protein [Riemerella columbina]|uniref:KilA-N domain-containing protein n=1 Tax=Riemerella columbina TaxID=103810 RepID=UPI00037A354E|nr:KilA-N domain-containing protein [Riemerella columbina]
MAKTNKIEVSDKIIAITSHNNDDYICLTDMVRGEEGNDHIRNWMRNRNTVEFLGIWEQLYNPNFKGVEFDTFKKEAGLNSFNLTPRKWIEATNAIGIISKSGRNGGTYAHKDIAFEFGAWISPMFKLLLIKEFQRLKEIESNEYNLEWNVKRILSKINYHIQTDAVKKHLIPKSKFTVNKQWIEYAEEADLLNMALFGCTAKQWKEVNPQLTLEGKNMRDFASINELAVLSNLESLNSELIKANIDKETRFNKLKETAKQQLAILDKTDILKSVKKISDTTYLNEK